MNTQIYEVIFPLLRTALWGEEAFPFVYNTPVDWTELNKELCAQTIHHLPIDILSQTDSSNSLQYFQNAGKALRSWYRLMQGQQELYILLKAEEIPFVVLKGAAVDCYYPKPAYRCMGDIDFIVKPEDFDRTAKCLESHEFSRIDEGHPRHNEYMKNGVSFELHRTFATLTDKEASAWMDNLLYGDIDHLSEKTMDGFSFPVLPALSNGLVLLEHISHHMEEGLGLRQIIDWMLYVDKELSDDFWNDVFCAAADRLGLKTLAVTVTKMCQMYLGLSKKLTWCQDADDSLCETLMDYVIEQGNFGRKLDKEQNTAVRTMSMTSIPALFKRLQLKGLNNWTATQKYPFLKPFAWIYQICRYIHLGLKRENPLKQLKEDYQKSQAQNDFFNRLGVTRFNNETGEPR